MFSEFWFLILICFFLIPLPCFRVRSLNLEQTEIAIADADRCSNACKESTTLQTNEANYNGWRVMLAVFLVSRLCFLPLSTNSSVCRLRCLTSDIKCPCLHPLHTSSAHLRRKKKERKRKGRNNERGRKGRTHGKNTEGDEGVKVCQ
jgi:hypothetical protein